MIYATNQPMEVVFLLVDANLDPVTGAKPSARVAYPGESFTDVIQPITEVGAGWYRTVLPGDDMQGPVIFVATASGAHPWRDIHQIVAETTAPDIAAIVQAELQQWAAELTLPIKLIRTGSDT